MDGDGTRQKWWNGADGVDLSFSFPWTTSNTANWQSNYSTLNEPTSGSHAGFNTAQQNAAIAALQSWAGVANIRFTQVSETSSNVGDFRFAFTSVLSSSVWGESSYPNSFFANAADVWVNLNVSSQTNWSGGSYNEFALIHETGHGLGLKHPGNYNAGGGGTAGPYLDATLDDRSHTVMSYYTTTGNLNTGFSFYPTTPMVLDVQAMQYIYGANTTTNACDTTYTFTDQTTYHQTIWDAGGNDTIAYTGSRAASIDLTAGHSSRIGLPVYVTLGGANQYAIDNVWIAYGAQIENAQGGSGNDTIIGNSGDNVLTGGAGNDNISGGGGIDTARYLGKVANFSISVSNGVYTVRDNTGAEGTDTLTDIARIQFGDTATVDLAFAAQARGAPVTPRGASDAAGAIATQLSVVYLGRPVGPDLAKALAGLSNGAQPSEAALAYMANLAIADLAFHATDTSRDIVVNTFSNIMGFLPSAFEQQAWAQYIDNGTLSRAAAPWVIFQSYLGATNVPDQYKLPTQARFVSAQTFSDYTLSTTGMAALNQFGSVYAEAARTWLDPVNSVAHAAFKMQTMASDITVVTTVGVAPADTFQG